MRTTFFDNGTTFCNRDILEFSTLFSILDCLLVGAVPISFGFINKPPLTSFLYCIAIP